MIYAINKWTKEHVVVSFPSIEGDWYTVKADMDGWIPWGGGGRPLPERQECEVRFKDGSIASGHRAGFWNFDRTIIAYRPILDSEPEAPEWDGEGLPPVGCECEALSETGWIPATIIGHYKEWVVSATEAPGHDVIRWSRHSRSFRPRRTAAQREEDEAVEAMFALLRQETGRNYMQGGRAEECCKILHRAGYRKE